MKRQLEQVLAERRRRLALMRKGAPYGRRKRRLWDRIFNWDQLEQAAEIRGAHKEIKTVESLLKGYDE